MLASVIYNMALCIAKPVLHPIPRPTPGFRVREHIQYIQTERTYRYSFVGGRDIVSARCGHDILERPRCCHTT